MPEIPAADAVTGVDAIHLRDGSLIESAVVLVKVSNADGSSSLHAASTAGMSPWERIGMLVDATDYAHGLTDWDD